MQHKFNRNILRLFPDICQRKGISLVLAVSSGVDSMVMAELARRCPYVSDVVIAHCNFHLRGEESDCDEAYVVDWAKRHGIRSFVKHFDTVSYASENSVSIEMAARDLRYGWFASLRKELGFDYVSVAHNLNDNVETVFLNLLRGTGIRGISGMKEISDGILRPMLVFSREMIEDFAAAKGLVYHTDSTNLSNEYKRNRIRNEVFPVLKKINPSFLRTMERNMKYFSEISDFSSDAAEALEKEAVTGENPVTVDYMILLGSRAPSFALLNILERYGFNPATSWKIFSSLQDEERTLNGNRFLSETHLALIDRGKILVYDLDVVPESLGGRMREITQIIPSAGGTTFPFGGKTYRIRVLSAADADFRSGELYLDLDKIEFPLKVRNWKQADRMRPFGMRKGSRKLSDIFSDAHYDVVRKSQVPVFEDRSGTIVALDCLRSSDICRLTETSVTAVAIGTIG